MIRASKVIFEKGLIFLKKEKTRHIARRITAFAAAVAMAAAFTFPAGTDMSVPRLGNAIVASAADVVASGKISGTSLKWKIDDADTLIISYTGKGSGQAMTDWTEEDYYLDRIPWAQYDIRSVVIEDKVTSIGNYAFFSKNIESITISDSVRSIGESAFCNCNSLESITIPDSVQSIGVNAFCDCRTLTSITIPDSVRSIGEGAFEGCTSLESITISDSVQSIGVGAFGGCSNLTSITIPDSVKSIGERAFFGCRNLKSITIPDSVRSIGEYAFCECLSLKSITIPDSVKSIGEYAFSGCDNLTSITIPNSVQSIGYSAFDFCTSLESIIIPDSVQSIGYSAFKECTSLESITIPDSVQSIGDYAFEGCTSLESIIIPDSVQSIGYSAFKECTSLESITIPDSVQSIGDYAFEGCTSLESITIPDSVQFIEYNVFSYCSNLTSIFLPEGLDVSSADILDTTTKIIYTVDDNDNAAITKIVLGSDQTKVDIPEKIGDYTVISVAEEYQKYVGEQSIQEESRVFRDKLSARAEVNGSTITLKWNDIKNADKYYVYQYKDGKYVKVKTTTDTKVTFKNRKNGETYKYLVRYTIKGKLSPTAYSGKATVKVYYKPIPKPTATKNSIKLTWEAVPGAKKYAVYKYADGKAVKLIETKKLSVKISNLTPDTEYKYIVRAYVDGKWTAMLKSDIVTVKTKAE